MSKFLSNFLPDLGLRFKKFGVFKNAVITCHMCNHKGGFVIELQICSYCFLLGRAKYEAYFTSSDRFILPLLYEVIFIAFINSFVLSYFRRFCALKLYNEV